MFTELLLFFFSTFNDVTTVWRRFHFTAERVAGGQEEHDEKRGSVIWTEKTEFLLGKLHLGYNTRIVKTASFWWW